MAFRKKRKDPFTEIQACLQRRDYKGALDWFNTLLQKDPENTQIRLRFADTLVLAGSKRDAVKQYRIVADELSDKGFMIRAIAINKKILQLDPNQKDVHDKIAEMSRERPAPPGKTTSLADVLTQPDAPLRRHAEPAAPEPPPASAEPEPAPAEPEPQPPPASEEPPATLTDISLEESMAMEFGAPPEERIEESVEEPQEPAPPADEPIPAPPPAEEPEVTPLPEEPSFEEEPMEFGGSGIPDDDEVVTVEAASAEPEPEPEIVLEGVEEPAEASPEIVLDFESASEEAEPALEAAAQQAQGATESRESEEPEAAEVYETGELEVVAFELEEEPSEAAQGAEPLLAALGEDIDSLIDSIIDDVGSSAKGGEPTEDQAPTHIPLFSDLTSSEFIDVALLLYRRVAKVGETIVKEGDPGDSMFIVSTGEVRATVERDGEQIPVATMKDGDFFGEMAVLSGEPRTATVTAVKTTELLELSRENLQEICSRHPHVEAKIRLAYDERVARSKGR